MISPSNDFSIQLVNADGSLAGKPATLASLGIESAVYDLNNLAADTFTFTVGGLAIDAASLWPYGQLIAVLNPARQRIFFGRVEPWDRDGRPEASDHVGRLVNPWWYLASKIYQQTYKVAKFDGSGNAAGFDIYTSPRVILNILYDAVNGFRSVTNGAQIADAVNWAIAQGAPIALGVTDPVTLPFSEFQKGIFCADVIKLMFRKEPDFVMDWDYTTTPFPTVHFRKPASLAPIVVDLTSITQRELVKIKERPDWQRSFVSISYDQTNTQAGAQYLSIFSDVYPPTPVAGWTVEDKFNCVELFADLTGYSTSSSSQTANFASSLFDITSYATWSKWKPQITDPKVFLARLVSTAIAANPATTPPTPALPAANGTKYPAASLAPVDEFDAGGNPLTLDASCIYEITDGSWADWIPASNAQRVRASAVWQIVDKSGHVRYETLTHDFTAVNVNTLGISQAFTQTTTGINSYAEPVPVGLAQSMWTSWRNLAIEGSFTNVEQIVGTTPFSRSNSLNFKTAKGGEDWSNVNALVQRISGDIYKGALTVGFGAPLHITGNELIDAVRATRFRQTTINIAYVFGGALGGLSANVRLARKTHARHSQHGATHTEKLVVSAEPILPTDTQFTVDPIAGTISFT